MARALGCSDRTLFRLKEGDRPVLKEGRHWRRMNPTAIRSNLVWHMARTLNALGAL